jgi:ring-1,2-phenylacetyl-CoA epoxidase subunit PaaC
MESTMPITTNTNTNTESLSRFVISLADDSLVLGQRLTELCSRAPYLEEDLAISNVALDYIGRASMFYTYAAELRGDGCTEDDIAFFRDERQYTNLLINELPNGDFAFTLLKQYYLDVFNCLYLEKLTLSTDQTLSAIAVKTLKESRYHLKRSIPWIRQLAGGTNESLERLELAMEELQSFLGEMFAMLDWETQLANQEIAVDRASLLVPWEAQVSTLFNECGLTYTNIELKIKGGRDGIHTEHLGHLLTELQFVQRSHPGLKW